MTIAIKHKFTSPKTDGADASLIQPSNWNDGHNLTGTANKLLGFDSNGAATEVSPDGTTLTLSGNTLVVADKGLSLTKLTTDAQATIDGKAPKASPGFTGAPTAPTPPAGDNSDRLATTSFQMLNGVRADVQQSLSTGAQTQARANISAAPASHKHTAADITDFGSAIAGKADKDSPSFTGTVTSAGPVSAPTHKSAGTTARVTGFQLADGTDLGEVLRVTQSYDDIVANCGGNIPTGNCNGNTKWTPPDGNWWNWVGVTGITRGNPYLYPAPSTYTNTPVTVALVYGNYAVTRDEIGGLEQHRSVNNCNCGAFNCYTNCAANCNCNCSSCCFLPGAKVLLADGSLKRIMDVRIGDQVQGRWGVNTVKALTRPVLGHRTMIVVNETLWNTTDHPMWTRQGWRLVDKDYWLAHDVGPAKELFGNDGESLGFFDHPGLDPDDVGIITIGMDMATPGGFTALTSLRFDPTVPPEQQLYGLVLDGDHIYYVDGYAVGGWAERDIDYRGRIGL